MNNPIPIGIIKSTGGLQVPISSEISYVAGPDTTHANALGISGNRKTSYLAFSPIFDISNAKKTW
jgi:hypothetical protein